MVQYTRLEAFDLTHYRSGFFWHTCSASLVFHWMIDGEPPSNGPKLDTWMYAEDQEPGSQGPCRSTHTHILFTLQCGRPDTFHFHSGADPELSSIRLLGIRVDFKDWVTPVNKWLFGEFGIWIVLKTEIFGQLEFCFAFHCIILFF